MSESKKFPAMAEAHELERRMGAYKVDSDEDGNNSITLNGFTVAYKQALRGTSVTPTQLWRSYKNSPHNPLSLALKYIVHRHEKQDLYADPGKVKDLDDAFLELHTRGKAANKNGHIKIEALHEFMAAFPKILPALLAHKKKLGAYLRKYNSKRIRDDKILLFRGSARVLGTDHALASYTDVHRTAKSFTGENGVVHGHMVPIDNIWYSYDLGPRTASSKDWGPEDEFLVSPHGRQPFNLEHPWPHVSRTMEFSGSQLRHYPLRAVASSVHDFRYIPRTSSLEYNGYKPTLAEANRYWKHARDSGSTVAEEHLKAALLNPKFGTADDVSSYLDTKNIKLLQPRVLYTWLKHRFSAFTDKNWALLASQLKSMQPPTLDSGDSYLEYLERFNGPFRLIRESASPDILTRLQDSLPVNSRYIKRIPWHENPNPERTLKDEENLLLGHLTPTQPSYGLALRKDPWLTQSPGFMDKLLNRLFPDGAQPPKRPTWTPEDYQTVLNQQPLGRLGNLFNVIAVERPTSIEDRHWRKVHETSPTFIYDGSLASAPSWLLEARRKKDEEDFKHLMTYWPPPGPDLWEQE